MSPNVPHAAHVDASFVVRRPHPPRRSQPVSRSIPTFQVIPVPGCHPEIGRWLATLDDARERTMYSLRRVTDEDLTVSAPAGRNSIGTLLYHVAITDLNWVFDNYLRQPYPAEVRSLFPAALLDAEGDLTTMSGGTLEAHLERMRVARAHVREVFRAMSVEEFHALVDRDQDGPYHITPESILRHLAQHEAEHRGEIHILLDARNTARA